MADIITDIPITNNVEHTTAVYEKTTSATGSTRRTLTLNADSGYKFETPPTGYRVGGTGSQTRFQMIIQSDTVASVTWSANPESITINGEVVSTTPKAEDVNITNNISDTTVSHTYTDGKVTIKVTGNLTPSNHFLKNVKAIYNETSVELQTTNNENENSATGIFEVAPNTNITITGEYIEIIGVNLNVSNCTVENVPKYFELEKTYNLIAKADEGKVFTEIPYLTHNTRTGSIRQVNFTLSDDKKTATLNFTVPYYIERSISIYAYAVTETPIAQNYGSINVYLTNIDEITQFAHIRFASTDSGSVDFGDYIDRIKRIYTNIPTGANDVMYFGNYITTIKTHNPKDTVVTLDFGNVQIPTPNNNIVDYESEILMFIPFVGNVSLSSEYMGETINLQIVIDVITGNGLYKVFHNDVLILTGECNPSNDILYRTYTDDVNISGGDWNESVFMGLEPYLYVKYFQSKNNVGRNNDFTRGLISSYTGFNVFDDITPITTPEMLANEQETIYNALQTGVYIE